MPLDLDGPAIGRLCALLVDKDAADLLLVGARLCLRAGPAILAVARLRLQAEQERLLAQIEPRLRIGLDRQRRGRRCPVVGARPCG